VNNAKLVDSLSHPQIRAAHATENASGTIAHSFQMPKASVDRAQYLVHLASLMGRELGLHYLFEARVIGREAALLFRENPQFSVIVESDAALDLDELADSFDGRAT
jgi:hypothetical protein